MKISKPWKTLVLAFFITALTGTYAQQVKNELSYSVSISQENWKIANVELIFELKNKDLVMAPGADQLPDR